MRRLPIFHAFGPGSINRRGGNWEFRVVLLRNRFQHQPVGYHFPGWLVGRSVAVGRSEARFGLRGGRLRVSRLALLQRVFGGGDRLRGAGGKARIRRKGRGTVLLDRNGGVFEKGRGRE